MNRLKNSLTSLSTLSSGLTSLVLIGFTLPVLILSGFGIYSVFKYGYKLEFVIAMSVSAFLIYMPKILSYLGAKKTEFTKKSEDEHIDYEDVSTFIQPSPNWSGQERKIWTDLNSEIVTLLSSNADWSELYPYSLKLIELTSKRYGRKEMQFSIPEALMMSEELSRRYRVLLQKHIPFIEKVKVSHVKFLYDKKEGISSTKDKAMSLIGIAGKVWRGYRATDPIAAVISEVKTHITNKLSSNVSNGIQAGIKKALLQEIVSVSIDLYSGRFAIDSYGLPSSKISGKDDLRSADAIEPLRVVIGGQVNSGSASLINALTKKVSAEVSILPSIGEVYTHSCKIEEIDSLRLVQLPGLNGSKTESKVYLNEITQADIVIWLLKADRPSKALDKNIWKEFNQYYEDADNLHRKKPVLLGVINQVDRLKPTLEWNPPYDLNNALSEKAKTIVEAVKYNTEIFDFDETLPLSISEDKPTYNLEKLESLIQENYEKGLHAQLNRRRLEASSPGVIQQLERILNSGKALFNVRE